jgi:hypothetical protein
MESVLRLFDRFLSGAVAQLGERQVRNLEVVGSIPICSTIFYDPFFSMAI